MLFGDIFDYGILAYQAISHHLAANSPFRLGISHLSLPSQAIFPGPWDENIKAPSNKSHIRPVKIRDVEGAAYHPDALLDWSQDNSSSTLEPGGKIVLEFSENIAGRPCFQINSVSSGKTYLGLAYSESPAFVGRIPDATTDRQERDLPLYLPIRQGGISCVGPAFVRGAFKYLTIYIPKNPPSSDDAWSDASISSHGEPENSRDAHQKPLSHHEHHKKRSIAISSLWVNCTAFPSNPNPRAYTGYFSSSSSLLNRIWYAGAYTLQLTTIDPAEGSALIDYNRRVDNNESPQGSWYSNFTIANGTAITTDGAKRDRMAYPGDMAIAVPGIAVSTYDMVAVRTALDSLFIRQYDDGSLPYAGPPMGYSGEFSDTYHLHTLLGVWNYILFTNDIPWLQEHWSAYLSAFEVSLGKVDLTGLYHVTSTHDWLRPGMTGHNLEVTAIMYYVLQKTIKLADEIVKDPYARDQFGRWNSIKERMERGVEILYCAEKGLYGDNVGRRGCGGTYEVLPQDGNSWALLSGIISNGTRRLEISQNLRSRWLKYGAPATEFPSVISPFASSFELLAHCAAGNYNAAVELMELMWGYMLDGEGFTNSTLVEGYRVDGDIQYPAYWSSARNSHAHGWSTGPTMVLLTEILGIHLETPLGRTWTIFPHLTKWLESARGGFATGMGRFEVSINRMKLGGSRLLLVYIDTPRGSKGTVELGTQKFEVLGGRHQFVKDNFGAAEWEEVALDWKEQELTKDDDWQKPEIQERPAGVVDWEVMDKYYAPPAG